MAKERYVTRTVIDAKTYNVFSVEGTNLELLATIERKGKISEKELAKEYEVKQVVIVCTDEKKTTYGMTVSEFMENAKVINEESKEETTI